MAVLNPIETAASLEKKKKTRRKQSKKVARVADPKEIQAALEQDADMEEGPSDIPTTFTQGGDNSAESNNDDGDDDGDDWPAAVHFKPRSSSRRHPVTPPSPPGAFVPVRPRSTLDEVDLTLSSDNPFGDFVSEPPYDDDGDINDDGASNGRANWDDLQDFGEAALSDEEDAVTAPPQPAPPPKQTHFLALDKCLPGRKFLEVCVQNRSSQIRS